MAIITQQHGFEVYTIISADGGTRASFVPEKGGVGSSIIMSHEQKERELLFLHDSFWEQEMPDLPGGWPFLFPVCARIERMGNYGNYLYDCNVYSLPIHGFSWNEKWRVLPDQRDDTLTLELTETKNSLAAYPFRFKVQLTYKVTQGKLTCHQIYTNTGNKPMVYYAGFHPYFLTPEANSGKEQVMLNFQPKRLLRYNDKLTDIIGEQKLFNLPIPVTDNRINEQLCEVKENNITHLAYPDGFNLYMQTSDQFRYLQTYTMTDKPFFCVEPWMAFPNALNTSTGCRWLASGKSEQAYVELACNKPSC
ncbi:MAG: aldose epimerase [Gammaproteobacteria bacterium]|nr:aldose epimerase [Gammaproteobacteria bacterium]